MMLGWQPELRQFRGALLEWPGEGAALRCLCLALINVPLFARIIAQLILTGGIII